MSALLVVTLCMQVIVLSSSMEKKMVFDLIPKMISKTLLQERRETNSKLRKTLRNLWNQYNGNWLGRHGKISLLSKYVGKMKNFL